MDFDVRYNTYCTHASLPQPDIYVLCILNKISTRCMMTGNSFGMFCDGHVNIEHMQRHTTHTQRRTHAKTNQNWWRYKIEHFQWNVLGFRFSCLKFSVKHSNENRRKFMWPKNVRVIRSITDYTTSFVSSHITHKAMKNFVRRIGVCHFHLHFVSTFRYILIMKLMSKQKHKTIRFGWKNSQSKPPRSYFQLYILCTHKYTRSVAVGERADTRN